LHLALAHLYLLNVFSNNLANLK